MEKKFIALLMILESKLNKEGGYYKAQGDGIAKIKIANDMEPLGKIWTLYHEFSHFIFDIFKVKKFKDNKRISDKAEEKICEEIADRVEKTIKKCVVEKGYR